MTKVLDKKMNILNILVDGFLIYVKNFKTLSKIMLFPTFGQLLGLAMIFFPSYFFSKNILAVSEKFELLSNPFIVFITILIVILPGFILYTAAIWDYLVAMATLNSKITNILVKKDIFDESLNARKKDYAEVWTIFALIWIVLIALPAFAFFIPQQMAATALFAILEVIALVILTIMSVYFSLVFQVFALEKTAPIFSFKRSFQLVKGNFWRTTFLSVILIIITQSILPQIIDVFMILTGFIAALAKPIEIYLANILTNSLLLKYLSLTIAELSKIIASSLIGMSVTTFVLPYGAACYTLLYHDIVERKN